MKDKYIALTVALGVVAFFFGQDLFPAFAGNPEREPERDSTSLISLPTNFNFPTLNWGGGTVAEQAWNVFERYREYARQGDLEGVMSLSHQVSDTCRNPETREECNVLMQSVFLFTEGWEQKEFTNTVYDDMQIVLSTDFIKLNEEVPPAKTVMLFTRLPAQAGTATGEPRMLGIKFCVGEENPAVEKCFDTDPATRDTDNNGWWDDIEAQFYR
jgi:hypothetical protein